MLPPGPAFIVARLPRLLAPLCVTYALIHLSTPFAEELPWLLQSFVLTSWGRAVLLACALPAWFAISLFWSERKKRQEAEALGAVMPPVISGKLPGNIDAIISMARWDKDGYLADMMSKIFKERGNTIDMKVLWEDKILTTEPEIIKTILATDFSSFEKGKDFKKQMQDVLGDGVFNADGDLWKFHRQMTRPFFSRERISHFELFGRHVDTALSSARSRAREGVPVDAQDLFSRFTLDSATEFLFGHCVDALKSPLLYPTTESFSSEKITGHAAAYTKAQDAASRFAEAFASAQLMGAKRGRYNSAWPLWEFWRLNSDEHMGIINAYIDPILNEAVAKKRAGASESSERLGKDREIEEGDTLLDHLIHYTEDTKMLKDEILNIMIAGRDTTAALLTFAIYCLADNPSMYKRVREEVLAVIGSNRSPTYEDLKEMKYVRAVLNETLRLYPPVPFDSRSSTKATTVPNPTPGAKPWYVPARTRIIYSVFLMHRREDLWGPDASVFDPDRFLDSRVSTYLTPNPFAFLPFNAGPRICLGQQFAYNEASFMLARFVQAFAGVELALDALPKEARPPASWAKAPVGERKRVEKVWPKSHLTMYAHGGLWVRLQEAAPLESA